MRIQKIHHCIKCLRWIPLAQFFQIFRTIRRTSSSCVGKYRIAELIIHARIIHIAKQIFCCVSPDFSDNDIVTAKRFHGAAEFLPCFIRNLICAVQAPSIGAFADPVFRYRIGSVDQLFCPAGCLVLRTIGSLDDRHRVIAPPAFITINFFAISSADCISNRLLCRLIKERVSCYRKPLCVSEISHAVVVFKICCGSGLRCILRCAGMVIYIVVNICPVRIGADFPVYPDIFVVPVKINRVIRNMIINAVEDNVHPVSLGCLAQFGEIAFRAEDGVDFLVIRCVVPVVGHGRENWVNVNHVHPKFFQIVDFLRDSLNITAIDFIAPYAVPFVSLGRIFTCVLALLFRIFRIFAPVLYELIVGGPACTLWGSIIVRGITIIEAVREYLINHRILHPVRCFVALLINH